MIRVSLFLPCLGLIPAGSVWQQQGGGWGWTPGAPFLMEAAALPPWTAGHWKHYFFTPTISCRGFYLCLLLQLTFGAVIWKLMLVTGMGADDSMEMITTSTSGRDGGESRAKWKRTRRLFPSNTVTGKRLPAEERRRLKSDSTKTRNNDWSDHLDQTYWV